MGKSVAIAIAEIVFWNYGLDVTTWGLKYRASMFIKTSLLQVFFTLILFLNSDTDLTSESDLEQQRAIAKYRSVLKQICWIANSVHYWSRVLLHFR